MNPEWIQSDRIPRRHAFARQDASDEIWPETDAFPLGVLDQDASYTSQFEGSSFSPTRPTHPSSGQYGYRGRPASQPYPQSYAAGMDNIQRARDTRASPLEPNRATNNAHQWGAPNNQVSKLPNSQSLEIANLNRKLASLQDEITKDRELKDKLLGDQEKKWSDLEGKVTRQGNLRDLLTEVEEKYKRMSVPLC